MEICTDNRFELIEKYKKELLESTNIADSEEEMNVIDSILFRFWQMGWLDGLENVNRQKAEIERLESLCEKIGIANDAKFERICVLQEDLETAKSEAVKEFAERLKVKVGSIPQYHFNLLQVEEDIDTLVKEMTEDKSSNVDKIQ